MLYLFDLSRAARTLSQIPRFGFEFYRKPNSGRAFVSNPFEKVVHESNDQIIENQQKPLQNCYKLGFTEDDMKDVPESIKRVLTLENAAPSEILAYKIKNAIKKFQNNPLDTGSLPVQIAVLTERILHQIAHCTVNRHDVKASHGLRDMVIRRRTFMCVLMSQDYHRYKWVQQEYNIPEIMPTNANHKINFRLRRNKCINNSKI